MSTKTTTRGLWAIFCLLVAFLASRLLFPAATPPAPPSAPPHRPVEIAKREVKRVSPRKAMVQAEMPIEKESLPQAEPVETAEVAVPDPDEEFLESISSLPLDHQNLEVRLEVERRIKTNEKGRAKLIFSEKKNGKSTIAYAVKQPSLQEIKGLLKLYQTFLDRQTDPNSKAYVDERYQTLVNYYDMTQGRYRLLYAVIPEGSGGLSVEAYSYPASSEQDCMAILKLELAPRPPYVIGVPVTGRSGRWSLSVSIIPGRFRMEQLVSEDLLKPFYINTFRAQLGIVTPSANE